MNLDELKAMAEEAKERAASAREVARPIADTVDWHLSMYGEIDAAHQSEPITTQARLGVITFVLAEDVIALVDAVHSLVTQVQEYKIEAETEHEWCEHWRRKLDEANRVAFSYRDLLMESIAEKINGEWQPDVME